MASFGRPLTDSYLQLCESKIQEEFEISVSKVMGKKKTRHHGPPDSNVEMGVTRDFSHGLK